MEFIQLSALWNKASTYFTINETNLPFHDIIVTILDMDIIADNFILLFFFICFNLTFITFVAYVILKNYQKKAINFICFTILFFNLILIIFKNGSINIFESYFIFILINLLIIYLLVNLKEIWFFILKNNKSFRFVNLLQILIFSKIIFRVIEINFYEKLSILGVFFIISLILINIFKKQIYLVVSKFVSKPFILTTLMYYFNVKELTLKYTNLFLKTIFLKSNNIFFQLLFDFYWVLSILVPWAFFMYVLLVSNNDVLFIMVYGYSIIKILDNIIFNEIIHNIKVEDQSFRTLLRFSSLNIKESSFLLTNPLIKKYRYPYLIQKMKFGTDNLVDVLAKSGGSTLYGAVTKIVLGLGVIWLGNEEFKRWHDAKELDKQRAHEITKNYFKGIDEKLSTIQTEVNQFKNQSGSSFLSGNTTIVNTDVDVNVFTSIKKWFKSPTLFSSGLAKYQHHTINDFYKLPDSVNELIKENLQKKQESCRNYVKGKKY